MKINIENETISSVDFSETETAWAIKDAILVLEYLRSKNKIVLGGDILTETLAYSYDSWYYNADPNWDFKFNIEHSINLAHEYISNYMSTNGDSFFVVFVLDNDQL